MESRRYGVIGNPIAHSLSPQIHAAFAAQAGGVVDYRRVVAPLDGFATTVERFFAEGGRGLNVTLPFKVEARALCDGRVAARASAAGAVNWLQHDDDGIRGDNTDGIGLVADLTRLLADAGTALAGSRVLLIGAGGAARGVVFPLVEARIRSLAIVNRDRSKAERLVAGLASRDVVSNAFSFDAIAALLDAASFDVIVNATSASLSGAPLPLEPATFTDARLAYDMMYGATPTAFMTQAAEAGARTVSDGLGMLVEQAAESYRLWHGVRPRTAPVLAALRASLGKRPAS